MINPINIIKYFKCKYNIKSREEIIDIDNEII